MKKDRRIKKCSLNRGCTSYEVDQLLKENGIEKGFLGDKE